MKIIFLFYTLFFSVVLFAQPSFPGSGTETDPYQIWTKEHLDEYRDSVLMYYYFIPNWENGKYFRLMSDITDTIKQSLYGLIGGHFNGNGKRIIIGIDFDIINNPSNSLFGEISENAILDGLIVDGYINGFGACAAIAYYVNNATVTNCINNVTANVYSSSGIIYDNRGGTISNCINNGDITGVSNIGGICGQNVGGTITNCINTGKITATNSSDINIFSGVGGIAASLTGDYGGSATGCINLGSVEGQGIIGGIVGAALANYLPIPIIGCVNYGYISGTNGVGGILGYMFNSLVNISDCVNEGVIEGEEDVGATVGKSK